LVREAATVAEAMLELARLPKPAWILLDLMLPDGCGIEVLRHVRSENWGTQVCIITGCGSELLAQARLAGAAHTFLKPLNVDHLMTVLSE
jgi:two-component system CitB family response regulator